MTENRIIIGNKKYKYLNIEKIISKEFKRNTRFNLHEIKEDTKLDDLCCCIHVYDNLNLFFDFKTNKRKNSFDLFYNKYKHSYSKDKSKLFFDNFKPTEYTSIFNVSNKLKKCNTILKNINCPLKINNTVSRQGLACVLDHVSKNKKVYLFGFTISEHEKRRSYITDQITDDIKSSCHYKSNLKETKILKWLHNNNYIDLSLCLLEDKKELSFLKNEDVRPSEEMINLIERNKNYFE